MHPLVMEALLQERRQRLVSDAAERRKGVAARPRRPRVLPALARALLTAGRRLADEPTVGGPRRALTPSSTRH